MAVEVEIDVELLKREIKKTYASVSEEPEKDFIFPTGRAWAEDLDYPDELANVPEAAVESFAGVANPWTMGRLAEGERVLDLGSGAGTDSLIAAQMVGDEGSVTGVDMTTEMLERLAPPPQRWAPRTSSSSRARPSSCRSRTGASTS
jgi:SAM-dependent methyltransferase